MIDIDHGASELQRVWDRHGQSRWGYGVAVSIRDLEQRVAALEKLVTNHDAVPTRSVSGGVGMTDRDCFAAAALTGLLARVGDKLTPADRLIPCAYNWADEMLRERENTNHDAAPAARGSGRECTTLATTGGTRENSSGSIPADLGDGVSPSENDKNLHHTTDPGDGWRLLEPGEVIREGDEFHSRYGWTRTYRVGGRPDPQTTYRRRKTAPPCAETDGPPPRKCVPPAAVTGSGEGSPPGVPQADKAQATGGRGHNTQDLHATPRECSEPVGYAVVLASGRIYTRCDFEFEAQAIADALPVAEGAQATVAGMYLSRPEPLSGSGKSGNAGQPTLTDEERDAILRLSPSGDPLASRMVLLTPEDRRVFHGLLERLT